MAVAGRRGEGHRPDYLDNLALEWELTDADSPYAVDYSPQWPYIQSESGLGRIYSLANANFITVADKSTVEADTVYRRRRRLLRVMSTP